MSDLTTPAAPVRPPRWAARVTADWTAMVLTIACLGLLLRLGIARRDLNVVDRLFVPDDTYYTLSISRSIAESARPAVEGGPLTSGFQPLLAFLMTPVFLMTSGADAGLRGVLVLLSLADAAVIVLLGVLVRRVTSDAAGLLAAGLWAFSPLAVGLSLSGMESTLALGCELGLLLAWWRARDTGSLARFAVAGALAGVALLARIDAAFVVVALAVVELLGRHVWRLLVAGSSAALVVAPWWIYCTAKFGSPIPESGAAVAALVREHELGLGERLGWASGTLFGVPFLDWESVRHRLYDQPVLGIVAWAAFAVVFVWVAWRLYRTAPVLAAFVVAVLGMLAFYSFYVSALWFFRRYLISAEAVVTALVAAGLMAVWRRRREWKVAAPATLGVAGLACAFGVTLSVAHLVDNPSQTPAHRYDGAKGYREVAADVLSQLPHGAVVGSLQSGALAYYAPDDVRVVNLDGVVDGRAADALKTGTLAAYAHERGVTYLADWEFNVRLFLRRSGDPTLTRERLVRQGQARPQGHDAVGQDQFVILSLPPAAG